jgi:hypothetical protein
MKFKLKMNIFIFYIKMFNCFNILFIFQKYINFYLIIYHYFYFSNKYILNLKFIPNLKMDNIDEDPENPEKRIEIMLIIVRNIKNRKLFI